MNAEVMTAVEGEFLAADTEAGSVAAESRSS